MTSSPTSLAPAESARWHPAWLFSAPVDLAIFLGSAVVALFALAVGVQMGWTREDHPPDWTWVPAVLLIDVAHVWSTGFRVYFDPTELRRRPWLYGATPVICFLVGLACYLAGQWWFGAGEQWFWRALAYVAVFHFVRQQYGWVALYRAKAGDRDRVGRCIDTAAIYLATVYPLVYWHCHLPRQFWWFLPGDFAPLPGVVERLLAPVYWAALVAYACRACWLVRVGRPNPGKDIVVATTAVCWYVGIVVMNSDYAFMVTNVIIHGVPYMALVYWYRFRTRPDQHADHAGNIAFFLGTLWLLAYVEELLWHRSVWNERGWLFGGGWEVGGWRAVLVPLLAVPQLTHYVLDGFIWRRKSNPDLSPLTETKVSG